MPMLGANMRLYTVARLSPGSAEKTNTPCADDFDAVNRLSSTPRFTTALSTALRVVSGTKRNGTPHDTTCTGRPVPATAAGESESAAAARAGSGIGSPYRGSGCVIHTKLSSSPVHVIVTGTGPMLSPNTNRSRPRSMTPVRARANVAPIVGWPASGSSSPGVKIRMRTSVSGCSAGSMNVVSEKFISFAIACIVSEGRPRPSSTTASWLPLNRWSVKTS